MKNFLLGYFVLTSLSITMALEFDSFDPIKTFYLLGKSTNDNFGYSSSSSGDINKDGYDDIIIGAYGSSSNKGAAYVIYGGDTTSLSDTLSSERTTTTTLTNLDPLTTGFKITGNAAGDYFGYSVSSAGDINKDGYADIIIGAYGSNNNQGAAYVIYGGEKSDMVNIDLSTETLQPDTNGFMITGNTAGDYFGRSVSTAGDINKDGYADIIIGANGFNSYQGAAYIIYGGKKSSMSNIALSTALDPLTIGFMITGNAAGDYFGRSVASAGDINKDGYADIIIGAYGPNNYQGAAYVIYGGDKSALLNIDLSTQTLDPLTTGFKITGNAAGDYFGYSVSSAGDIDNDGYDDIIVGAFRKNSRRGAAYVIYGGKESLMVDIDLSSLTLDPATNGFTIAGSGSSDYLGVSVSSAGDINQDGYGDVIIGANGDIGNVYVIYGGEKSSLSNIAVSSLTNGFSILGTTDDQGQTGISVSAADINGDKVSDLIIGAYAEWDYKGAVYLVLNQCPTNCDTCIISTSCQVCSAPYLLYSGQCLESCPLKTFTLDSIECQDCPAECSECTDKSTCQACIDGYTLSRSKCKKIKTEVKEKTSEEIAAGAFEGTSIIGASLSSGSSLPLNFGIVAKLLRNIKYMDLPVSNELYETFVSWKVGTGLLSAPDSWIEKYSSKTIPAVFSRYELQAAFLINFCKPLMMALIGMAIFGVFKVIEVVLNKKKNKVYGISKKVNVAASNFALTQFYSNLDDVIFYFVVEIRSTKFETGFRIGSSVLALVLFFIGGIFIGIHWKLIGKFQDMKNSPKQLKNYESKCENISLIFKDFKHTNSLIQSFLMINIGRSVISSLLFATLFEYPMIQISFLFVLNILMIVYLCKKKSFKEFLNTCSQIFCEVVLFLAYMCVFLLALFDHADIYPITAVESLSKCIIVLNFILLFGCAIFLLFSLLKPLYQSYLEKRKKAHQQGEKKRICAEAKFESPDLVHSNQSLSTNNGLVNESQDNYSQHDNSYQNNGIKIVTFRDNNLDKDSKIRRRRQGRTSSNSSVKNRKRSQNKIESFEIPNSNAIFQSNPTEDFVQETSQASLFSNVLPRSRLVRNREITKARIAQFSRNESPESRIQDPSFHSRMTLNEEGENQDASFVNFDLGTESPPLRENDLMPRRRARTMNK